MTKFVLMIQVEISHNLFGQSARISQLFRIFLKKSSHHMSIVHVARDCSISRKECKTWPENETGLSFKRPFFTSFGEFIIGIDFVPHLIVIFFELN